MKSQVTSLQLSVNRIILILLAAFVAALLHAPSVTHAQIVQPETVLVRFQPTLSSQERAAAIAALGGEEVAWLPQIHVAEIRLSVGAGQYATQATTTLHDNPALLFAESDYAVSAASLPNDPTFQEPAMHYALSKVQALAAWELTRGSNDIVIAVIDSGVKLDHPAFAGRLTPGYDFVNDDEYADDDSGHGTHVAGIIAAALNDQSGMAGLCPACRIMPVKVLNAYNLGTLTRLAQGILFATDNGARVINLSLGTPIPSQTLAAAVLYAQERGVLIVAAAGNHGRDFRYYPAALDGVIAVAATDIRDNRWTQSNYGTTIDLAAPGDLIFSTYHDLNNLFGGYTYMSGTSMAAPFVSALAGLVLSVAPALDNADVIDALLMGAEDLGQPGWDPHFGHGRVNAYKALRAPIPALVDALGFQSVQVMRSLYLPGIITQ